MLPAALEEEMAAVYSYKQWLSSLNRHGNTLELVTLELKQMKLTVTKEGWVINDNIDEPYPTFESVMKTYSPEFDRLWTLELDRKLQILLEEQEK